MRRHLLSCFEKEEWTAFPATTLLQKIPAAVKKNEDIEVICHCRMPPEEDAIIECAGKNCAIKRFHSSCVPSSTSDFVCESCGKRPKRLKNQ